MYFVKLKFVHAFLGLAFSTKYIKTGKNSSAPVYLLLLYLIITYILYKNTAYSLTSIIYTYNFISRSFVLVYFFKIY